MNRRKFLLSGVALGIIGAGFLKPSDNGETYDAYFSRLNQSLKKQGSYLPSMLIDLDKLDENIAALKQQLNPDVDYRIVAKSLPSPQLLGYIMDKAQTNKLMLFHQPFLSQITLDYPNCDVLMGKPMPVMAAAHYYQQQQQKSVSTKPKSFDSSTQLQWLIDSETRLEQYLQLAKQQEQLLQVNIELDIGLHRGGLQEAEQLDVLLSIIKENPKHLRFSGFMGYDPHVVKLPSIVKSAEDAYQESQEMYQSFISRLYTIAPELRKSNLCFNGAGSPSLAMHKTNTVANELSAGSCLVKPTDFDIPSLVNYQPAAFIATPVLKKMQGTQIPAVEFAKDVFPLWDNNMQQTFFIYGGKWLAKYESPKGLQDNGLYGTSTNQDMVNGSSRVKLNVDDHVFLRPSQSEYVFLQFGDIITYRNDQLENQWSILKQS